MHRRVEAERRDFRRHVMHAAVGEQDRAGDAVGRHVGERRIQRREQPRAVGFAVGLAGLDEAHVEAGDAAEPLGERRARGLGLRLRSPKFWLGLLSTTTATTEDSGSRSSRVNDGLASASTIIASASARINAPRLRTKQQQRPRSARAPSAAHSTVGNQRRERDAEIQRIAPTAPAARAAPACAPGRPCSCRSACTSRC